LALSLAVPVLAARRSLLAKIISFAIFGMDIFEDGSGHFIIDEVDTRVDVEVHTNAISTPCYFHFCGRAPDYRSLFYYLEAARLHFHIHAVSSTFETPFLSPKVPSFSLFF